MKISENMTAVTPAQPKPKRRLVVGWGIFISLSLLELLAVFYGRPSMLQTFPSITNFVRVVGDWVPVVHAFGRCAAQADAGTGLMLALNVIFFPLKLAAAYFAHPKKLTNPDTGWRAAWGAFYMLLIAIVALVPVYIWGWMFAPGDIGLASINKKTSALCSGGGGAFISASIQGGFAMLGAYVSAVIFTSLARSLSKLAGTRRAESQIF